MATFVALLRGINVGGKNLIKMPALKACFEDQGFDEVTTYIQSGNVVFGSAERNGSVLSDRIERILTDAFDYRASVVVRSRGQMRAVIADAPSRFGDEPDRFRYNVIFLKPPLTARSAMTSVSTREGVDQADAGRGVLYFSNLISRAGQSHLSKVVMMPVYQRMTIRNWNTTTKLLHLMDGRH